MKVNSHLFCVILMWEIWGFPPPDRGGPALYCKYQKEVPSLGKRMSISLHEVPKTEICGKNSLVFLSLKEQES